MYEESKHFKPQELAGDCDGLNKLSSIDFNTKGYKASKSNSLREKYAEVKKKLKVSECINELFTNYNYRSELACIKELSRQNAPQPYKYQIETIEKMSKGKFISGNAGNVSINIIEQKTLCIDLNNVLLDVYLYAAEDADAVLTIKDTQEEISIKLNPFLYDFLDDVRSKYELILYSSLNRKYLQAILDYLERETKYFAYSFDESFCLFANVFQGVKYINFLCESRSLRNILIVDTSVRSYPLNLENVIPIPCRSHVEDIILAKLGLILELFASEADIRILIKKYSNN